MAIVIKPITLEVSKPNVFQAIAAKQYDSNSRFLKATIINEGEKIPVLPTSIVTINAKRNDGESFSFVGEANDDGTATVPIHSDMLQIPGYVTCDVSIASEGSKLTSTTFTILVEEANHNPDDGISEEEQYDFLAEVASIVGDVASRVTSEQFGELRDEVRTETGNLWSAIGTANAKISKNEEELDTIRDDINNLFGKTTTLTESIQFLDNQISKNEEELETQNELIHQSLAPVIRKTARGTTIAITDISPIEHTVKVKALGDTNLLMYSKNMFNPSYNGNFIEMINKIVAVHNQAYILSVSNLFGNVAMSAVLEDGSTREWLTIGMDMTNLAFKIDGNKVYSGENFETIIDFEKHIEKFSLRVSSADLMNWDDTTKVQLEYGTISTEYEPSVEHVFSFPAGVTYVKIPSVYPVTLLMSQTEGVELEVEYNVDTKKYIDESKNASGANNEALQEIQEIKEDLEKQIKTTEKLSNQVAELGEGVNSAFEGVMYVANNMSPAIPNTARGTNISLTDISRIPHPLKITARNANILSYPYSVFVVNGDVVSKAGITVTNIGDRGIHIKGTSTAHEGFKLADIDLGTSWTEASSGVESATTKDGKYTISKYLYYDHTKKAVYVGVRAGLTVDEIIYPQIVEGSILTPYIADITTAKVMVSGGDIESEICTVNADGTVEGVTVGGIVSRYPTTTIISDTEGVTLEVEYNVDTKKYIDNKFAELAAMIVNS